jgi:hypothetical protein
MEGAHRAAGSQYLGFIRKRFRSASAGDGTWRRLAPSTVRQKGGPTPILKEDGRLYSSLLPGNPECVFRPVPDGIVVGSSRSLRRGAPVRHREHPGAADLRAARRRHAEAHAQCLCPRVHASHPGGGEVQMRKPLIVCRWDVPSSGPISSCCRCLADCGCAVSAGLPSTPKVGPVSGSPPSESPNERHVRRSLHARRQGAVRCVPGLPAVRRADARWQPHQRRPPHRRRQRSAFRTRSGAPADFPRTPVAGRGRRVPGDDGRALRAPRSGATAGSPRRCRPTASS